MEALTRRCSDADRDGAVEHGCMLVGDTLVHNMTCYENQPDVYWMCSACAEEYVTFWQEQWDEYHGEIRAGLSLSDNINWDYEYNEPDPAQVAFEEMLNNFWNGIHQ